MSRFEDGTKALVVDRATGSILGEFSSLSYAEKYLPHATEDAVEPVIFGIREYNLFCRERAAQIRNGARRVKGIDILRDFDELRRCNSDYARKRCWYWSCEICGRRGNPTRRSWAEDGAAMHAEREIHAKNLALLS